VEVTLELPEYKAMQSDDPQRYEQQRPLLAGIREETAAVAIRGLLFGPALPEERFGEIAALTLIIAQPDDAIHPVSTAEKLHNAIAGSRLVMAPRFRYYRTHEEDLIDTVAGFLDRVKDAG